MSLHTYTQQQQQQQPSGESSHASQTSPLPSLLSLTGLLTSDEEGCCYGSSNNAPQESLVAIQRAVQAADCLASLSANPTAVAAAITNSPSSKNNSKCGEAANQVGSNSRTASDSANADYLQIILAAVVTVAELQKIDLERAVRRRIRSLAFEQQPLLGGGDTSRISTASAAMASSDDDASGISPRSHQLQKQNQQPKQQWNKNTGSHYQQEQKHQVHHRSSSSDEGTRSEFPVEAEVTGQAYTAAASSDTMTCGRAVVREATMTDEGHDADNEEDDNSAMGVLPMRAISTTTTAPGSLGTPTTPVSPPEVPLNCNAAAFLSQPHVRRRVLRPPPLFTMSTEEENNGLLAPPSSIAGMTPTTKDETDHNNANVGYDLQAEQQPPEDGVVVNEMRRSETSFPSCATGRTQVPNSDTPPAMCLLGEAVAEAEAAAMDVASVFPQAIPDVDHSLSSAAASGKEVIVELALVGVRDNVPSGSIYRTIMEGADHRVEATTSVTVYPHTPVFHLHDCQGMDDTRTRGDVTEDAAALTILGGTHPNNGMTLALATKVQCTVVPPISEAACCAAPENVTVALPTTSGRESLSVPLLLSDADGNTSARLSAAVRSSTSNDMGGPLCASTDFSRLEEGAATWGLLVGVSSGGSDEDVPTHEDEDTLASAALGGGSGCISVSHSAVRLLQATYPPSPTAAVRQQQSDPSAVSAVTVNVSPFLPHEDLSPSLRWTDEAASVIVPPLPLAQLPSPVFKETRQDDWGERDVAVATTGVAAEEVEPAELAQVTRAPPWKGVDNITTMNAPALTTTMQEHATLPQENMTEAGQPHQHYHYYLKASCNRSNCERTRGGSHNVSGGNNSRLINGVVTSHGSTVAETSFCEVDDHVGSNNAETVPYGLLLLQQVLQERWEVIEEENVDDAIHLCR
ncbi:hypothetical protein DQ04_05141030 [Trypanosoma grayi]|uniref:hypothetical protein n=1 Tax=Trypanosoma grayi TaxID=71804 RepID=UPI0004F45439|nr:hypothetical protein DQ04_05141030 [Trypanosoma grayi]KEG09484.1 hypothetical protein DQ04_05141030 [Trypanosoma grayi]